MILRLVCVLLLGAAGAVEVSRTMRNSPRATGNDLMSVLGEIPQCALTCLTSKADLIGCSLLDIECQCASKNSTAILQPCLVSSCTYEETFKLLHIQAGLCNKPHNNRSLAVKLTAWTTGTITIVAVVLRFVARYLGGSHFWWDDWLQLMSMLLVIPMTVALLLNAEEGLGHHIYDLTYNQVRSIGKWTYITTICWALELILLKFSIVCLYVRIFPNPWLKRACAIFAVFSILYTGPLVFLVIFECMPIHAIWDLEAKKTAKCIDYIAVLRASVVFEVIAEIILFVLPVPVVLKLKLKRTKKIQLLIFFGLGTCIIGISIARLPTLPGVTASDDQTYTTVDATILGFVASVTGHVCAAVPTIRALFRLWCGSLDDSSSRPSRFASNGKRSSWYSKSANSQSNHSRNLASQHSIGTGKEKSKIAQQHFGAMPSQDSIALAELQPVDERTYQPPRNQRFAGPWNSGRPRRVPQAEQPPAIFRQPWMDGDPDDSSSDMGMLLNPESPKASSVQAIEAHMEAMEARMAALEEEVQYYHSRSDPSLAPHKARP